MNGPDQLPKDSGSWHDWQDYKSPDKTSAFNYSDSTEQHIGKSQEFHYGQEPIPEKM